MSTTSRPSASIYTASGSTAFVSYDAVQSLPEVWAQTARQFGQLVALQDPHGKPEVSLTYADLYAAIQVFAAGLQSLGVAMGDRIALFSDNSPRWFIADQGIMAAGGVNVVRSSQADRDELVYIFENSGSSGLVVENLATLKRLRPGLGDRPLKFVVLLSDETPPADDSLNVLSFAQLNDLGTAHAYRPVQQTRDMLATLIYTSGTSGRPKGVMLNHGNLLFEIAGACQVVTPQAGERVLSLLPSWHAYERTFEYFVLSQGCTQIYTSIRHIKADLKAYRPQYMVGVPRIWESIYEGVQKQFREQPPSRQKLVNFFLTNSQRYIKARRTVYGLDLENLTPSLTEKLLAALQMILLTPVHGLGDRLVYRKIREATGGQVNFLVSGGGSLAKHLDDFYEIIGVDILQGYGLTETSPIASVRHPKRNLRGTSGPPLVQTEIRIVDLETRQPLPAGQKGLILIRGPQIMQGYYQNPEATSKAIDPDGWFDSGDLGWVTPQGDLTITGRAKDTIVLTNGENIEPQPIEDACIRSAYVDQIMVVGQDQKMLGALIVPNVDALDQWAASQNYRLVLPADAPPDLALSHSTGLPNATPIELEGPEIQTLFRQELNREVKNRPGYRPDDRIGTFRLILEPFSIENGMLTQTLKIRRPVVTTRYESMIDGMFTLS
ncbi:MAG: long-chain fatty acid--CoA ligase [Synechococcales bacterium]|nr:long-chain fatty acid--CoA ligase [Synechococcales bacterium]